MCLVLCQHLMQLDYSYTWHWHASLVNTEEVKWFLVPLPKWRLVHTSPSLIIYIQHRKNSVKCIPPSRYAISACWMFTKSWSHPPPHRLWPVSVKSDSVFHCHTTRLSTKFHVVWIHSKVICVFMWSHAHCHAPQCEKLTRSSLAHERPSHNVSCNSNF